MTRMKRTTAALLTTAAIVASTVGAQAADIAVIAGSIEDGFFNLIKKGVDLHWEERGWFAVVEACHRPCGAGAKFRGSQGRPAQANKHAFGSEPCSKVVWRGALVAQHEPRGSKQPQADGHHGQAQER